ncbi:hypothetical protein ACFE04_006878 [Oxalis oulophora]
MMMCSRGPDKRCNKNRIVTSTKDTNPMPLSKVELKGMFLRFDKNRDGKLSRQELRDAFNSLGAMIPAWRAYWALHKADQNGDGYINEDELDLLVQYAIGFGYSVK